MSRRSKRNGRHSSPTPVAETRRPPDSTPISASPGDYTRELLREQADAIERSAYVMRVNTFTTSRDVGKAITSNALEGGATVAAMVNATERLSAYADIAIETINQRYHPALDCKEGCSYCCRKPGVLASVPELLRILDYVRTHFSETEIAQLAERARSYASQMEGRNCNDFVDESVPCPLLVEERCSVYEVRPLVCRGYNSTNVNACRAAHESASVTVPIFALIKDVTDGASVGAAQRLDSQGLNGSMVDLGRALNIALTAGMEFPEEIVNGGRALSPAENPSWAKDLWKQVRETARNLGLTI